MTEERIRNRLLTVGSPISYNDIKQNTQNLKKNNSCRDAKSPARDGKSLSKGIKIRETDDSNGLSVRGKFESEIQSMTNEKICEQMQADPIFKMKFQIWMKKVQSHKAGTSSSSNSNSGIEEQVVDEDDVNKITFKKSKSMNMLSETKLYERCRNLLVTRLLSCE